MNVTFDTKLKRRWEAVKMQEHKVVTSLQRIQSYDPHGGPFTTIGGVIREKAQIDMLLAYDFTELGKKSMSRLSLPMSWRCIRTPKV